MANDDSEQEEECPLSAEGAASDDDDESYDKAESADESESSETKEEESPQNARAGTKTGLLPSRPPRPPGTAFPRPGIGRLTLCRRSLSTPAQPASRPAVSRLRDDGDDGDEAAPSEAELQRRREENIRALINNSLQTCRQPLMSKFLSVAESQVILRKPFQSPLQGAPRMSEALRRKLAARRHFVPWGSSTPLPIPMMTLKPPTPTLPAAPEPPPEPPAPPSPIPEPSLPEGIEPLVLWQAPHGSVEAAEAAAAAVGGGSSDATAGDAVVVDTMLVRFLRPHQREGVQFMFDCVMGQRLEGRQGCILADDMGLGKTLQGITLMWTLLTSGHTLLGGCPIARRAIIVCPTSLVSNWDNECTKWLQGRLKTLAMCETSREDVVANIAMFLHPSNVYKVLIISYETFRMHAERFQVPHACDLLLCDEAHRLKNDATLTNRALDNLSCKRRVLLSGTPMQNHLDEFFAMVDFCNPGVLGLPAQFRKYYELPILAGREPDAAPEEAVLGEERSRELSGLTNNFILRRTNKLLSQHLPPKVIEVVCCRLTDLQRQLYGHFLQSKAARRVLNGRTSGVLSAITSLKKLCNHPKLIYDAVHSKAAVAGGGGGEDGDGGRADGFEDVGSLFPPGLFDNGRVGRGGMAAGWEAVSGKMAVLSRMLHVLYTETNDRIVLVSNYTSTLDLFAHLCRERGYPFVRLDGTTTINKRQKLVKVFNDPAERQFAFLLSSKAGGCGLNLIGANRLVLFDPDWNPANDQQAAARVWRDGQRKRVFVYRFLSTGSIEEKVYQRQLSKEGLKQLVSKNGKAAANVMTAEDLRELFRLNADTWSDTYDYMCGGPGLPPSPLAARPAAHGDSPIDLSNEDDEAGPHGGGGGARGPVPAVQAREGAAEAEGRLPPVHKRQSGEPAEEDLANWGHHPSPETVPDAVMRRVAAPDVSFIFSCSVAGKPIEGGDEEERRLTEANGTAAAAVAAAVPGTAGGPGNGHSTAAAPVTAARGIAGLGVGVRNIGSRGGAGRLGGRLSLPPTAPLGPTAKPPATAAAPIMTQAPAAATSGHRSGSSVQVSAARTAPAAAVVAAEAPAGQDARRLPHSAKPPPAPSGIATTPSAVTATSPTAVGASKQAPPCGGNRPSSLLQPQSNPGSANRPKGHNTVAAAGYGSSGGGGGTSSSGSILSSSITGAVVASASAQPTSSGTGGRPSAAVPAAATAGGAKPAVLPAGAAAVAAATAAGQSRGLQGGCPPAQPLHNAAGSNTQHPKTVPPMTAVPATATTATAAAPKAPPAPAPSKPAGPAPSAADAAPAAGTKGAVRGRSVMEASGGAAPEEPKPKRKRAPGWYIDSDDDDFL